MRCRFLAFYSRNIIVPFTHCHYKSLLCVCVSVDFNVPIKDGKVSDPLRINEALPTIKYCQERGARSIVLMSHLGRPDGSKKKKYTMAPLVPVLEEKLK